MLDEYERGILLASLRNGIGLTSACNGLHKSPKAVSEYILSTPSFQLQCQEQLVAGYQVMMKALLDAQNRRVWNKWKDHRTTIDQYITELNYWESFCRREDFNFENFTIALRFCKTLHETATAMGFTLKELIREIYKDKNMIQWLMQNGYQI